VVVRGRLRDPGAAPAEGEEMHELVTRRNLVVEQILSAGSTEPAAYLQ
jgi:hypothetical protein